MTRRLLMGLDLGGGGVRCLLAESRGLASHSALLPWLEFGGNGADFDLEAAFARVAAVCRAALARVGAGAEVIGIGVSAVRFGTVVLDAEGRALLAATNRDSRAALEAIRLGAEAGAELQARTGHWPMAIGTLGRLRALAQEGLLARAHAVLALNDWVAWRLTGELATDFSQAGVTGCWDVAAGCWAADVLARVGASEAMLPPVRAAGTLLGMLGARAAEALGLSPGIPVAVGGGDTQCALLGMGVLAAGSAGAVCGTTLPIQQVAGAPLADAKGALWLEPHLAPGAYVLESNAGPVGEAIEWLGTLLHPGARSGAARLLAEAAEVAPGAGGLLSAFGAQYHHARRLAFPVGDLALSHLLGQPEEGRAWLARAVLEGVGFAVRANLEQIRDCAGRGEVPLCLGGGMSRSRVFSELVANVLGEPIDVAHGAESTALGAALCAGVAAGVWSDLPAASRALPDPTRVVPDAAAAAVYADLYPRWREWLEAKKPGEAIAQGQALRGLARRGAQQHTGAAPRPRILASADLDEEALASLRALGEVEYASYRKVGRLLVGEKLVEALRGFEVFVTEIDLVDAKSLLELPELRVVAACRGDAVNVDAEACAALGIPVLHAPGRNADAVADLTLAFLLALARKLPDALVYLRDPGMKAGDLAAMGRAYASLRGRELWRKTVGLVGLGAVGRKVAERLLPFGVRLLVYDPWLAPERAIRAGAEPVSLEELLEHSDFVSLHAAVTDASRGLIGAAEIARMKPGACLVNTARAALVDEAALADALLAGRLGGAALDVFSVEPPGADHPLLVAKNVIVTPHVGGNTAEIGAHQGRIVSDDLARWLGGEAPRHVVKREALASFSWSGVRRQVDAATREWLLARPAPSLTDLQRDQGKAKPKQ